MELGLNSQLLYLKDMLECCKHSSDQHSNFQVKETGLEARLKSLTFNIGKDVEGWLMFTPDAGRCKHGRMSNLLAAELGHHHHSACDSVVVLTSNSIWYVLYLELKSNHPTPRDYTKQFKSTRQFMKYVFGLFSEFANMAVPEFNERYIVFCTGAKGKRSLDKKRTELRSKPATDPNNPRMRTVANGDSLFLSEFILP